MKITLNVPDEIAKDLQGCEPGEEKTVTFTVASSMDGELQGDVTEVEGYAEEAEEEAVPAETDPGADYASDEAQSAPKGKRKMPKAVVMIGLGK